MKKGDNNTGVFQGVMLGYFIVLLHVLLMAGLGILVIFFKGIITYMPLILLLATLFFSGSAYYLFSRLKSRGKTLRDAMASPLFAGKTVEISFLGGIASLKIDTQRSTPALGAIATETPAPPQLEEDPKSARIRQLLALARQLENNQFNPDVFNTTKRNLFH